MRFFFQRQIGFDKDHRPVLYMNLKQGKEDFSDEYWGKHLAMTIQHAATVKGSGNKNKYVLLMDAYGKA